MEASGTFPDLLCKRYVPVGPAAPTGDLLKPVGERVARILVGKHGGPDHRVFPFNDAGQDVEDRLRFLADSILSLVVERTVEAIQVHVNPHGFVC